MTIKTSFMRHQKTLSELLAAGTERLGSRMEATLLLSQAIGKDAAWLYAHGEEPVSPGSLINFDGYLARRCAGEPMAYITGSREFYGRPFVVNRHVLIPRPETEGIVDLALTRPLPANAQVLDLGTGSGCIALTLAAERPAWQVAATDISGAALEVAGSNRDRLQLDGVELLQGDLFDPVDGRCLDLVVSNPPYVADHDPHLEQGDLRFEPLSALAAGDDGLAIIERIAREAPTRLRAGGWLILEHGHDQGSAVRELLERAGLNEVSTRRDLAGIERITSGRRASK